MSITVQTLVRSFTFNGVSLNDPGPEFSPEEVKDVYSSQYPDISTAVIEGPEMKGDVAEYKFIRNVGTKG